MSKPRRLLFRLMAMLLGLSVFVLIEVVCRLGGWADDAQATDAFAEFAGVRPLFRLSADGQTYEVADNRRLFFAAQSFSADKSPGQRRIFVFGGSTVQGRPYSVPTAFGTFLKIGLHKADPTVDWDVINCGGVSYASYRLLPIMKECLQYEPDLFIVCTGHNEFLECITYAHVRAAAPIVTESHNLLDRLHSFRLLKQSFQPDSISADPPHATVLPEEVDAILDHQGGLAAYTRAQLHAAEIADQFRANLQQMIRLAATADVPLLLMLPPSNLRDCPPFKSEFSAHTTDSQQADVSAGLQTALAALAADPEQAVQLLRDHVRMDDRFAFSWYASGQAYLAAHRNADAEVALVRARDEDVCPLRMTSPLETAMTEVAAAENVSLLDVRPLMSARSRDGIVGDAVLVDHIHPSFRSHQQIALALIRQLQEAGHVRFGDDNWRQTAQAAFDRHLQSQDDLYFLHGQRTLRSLQAWTQGRADGPPLTQSKGSSLRKSSGTETSE